VLEVEAFLENQGRQLVAFRKRQLPTPKSQPTLRWSWELDVGISHRTSPALGVIGVERPQGRRAVARRGHLDLSRNSSSENVVGTARSGAWSVSFATMAWRRAMRPVKVASTDR
jgi:hypothetical protein